MTVQELIDVLNKIEDKSSPVVLCPNYIIHSVEEFNNDNKVYLYKIY